LDYLYELGVSVVLLVQGWGEWVLSPMKLFSFIGGAQFYLLIMPFLYWSIDTKLGIRVGIILLSSDVLSNFLKIGFHTGRPFWVSRQVEAYAFEYSFGLPSTHAQNSAAVFGLIAATFNKWWGWLIALLVIFFIGISRLYLAVHFPHDVILGWVVGFLLVWIFLKFEKPVAAWFTKQKLPFAILALFAISLLMLLVGFLLRSLNSGWQIPAVWIENASIAFPVEDIIDPLNIFSFLLSSGVFFGLSAGALWLSSRGGFSAKGNWGLRILRYLIGVAGVAVLWFGIVPILPDPIGWFGYALNYFLFALIGFWISALAPLVFLRFELATPN
jgi:membrane-associated phospholipid phosphatase